MLFSSILFIFYFLPLLLLVYYFSGCRNWALILGSVVFYVWGEGLHVIVLAASIAITFFAGLLIERHQGWKRIAVVTVSITVNLLVLGYFKYTPLILSTAHYFCRVGKASRFSSTFIHLPLGISFFTFQLISYLIDIHRGKIAAEHVPSRLATYIMMFPHLIAGPIVRYSDIVTEVTKRRRVSITEAGLGTQYFVVGLCQKVMIANTVARAADTVFALPGDQLHSLAAWIGTAAYTLQIYFDFCGYSNMAIGLALLLGFHFPKNFDYPYSAHSVREFWRRWHMTLSLWFRDYVYITLGGNRGGKVKTARNLVIVFVLTGLWHGASWTFVGWGLYHGLFLLIERIGFGKVLVRAPAVVRSAYTLTVVMVGWVFFRATTLSQAYVVLSAMFGRTTTSPWTPPYFLWLSPEVLLALIAGSILSFPVMPIVLDIFKLPRLSTVSSDCRVALDDPSLRLLPIPVLLLGFAISVVLLASGSLNPFLYLRF